MTSSSEEQKRLEKLRHLDLLDSLPDPAFDRLTRLASKILNAPISLVSLVDDHRQFFKSFIGLPEPWATTRETPLSHSFCKHVVATGQPLIIQDARTEPLVQHNLAVQDLNVIAYAGIPLTTSDGYDLGSFCAIHPQPHQWTEEEVSILSDLAASAITEIELRNELRERKLIEEKLLANEQRYRLVSELMLDYMFAVTISEDGQFNIDWITEEAIEKVTGYHWGDIKDIPNFSIIVEEDEPRVRADMQAVLQGEARGGNYQIKTKQGEIRWLQINRFPIWNEAHDRVVQFYGIARDVTTRKEVEKQQEALIMEQIQAEALRKFVTNMSHDFRTPLTIINTSLYILENITDSDRRQIHRMKIKQQLEQMEQLIDKLSYITQLTDEPKLDDPNSESTNLNQEVDSVYSSLLQAATEKGLTLTQQLHDRTHLMIHGKSEQVSLVVHHVVLNALQYTSAPGDIHIQTYIENNQAVVEVRDNGVGIADDHLHHIFERFYRVNEARTDPTQNNGMGLAIVKNIVERLNGSITVDSTVEQGSIFRLFFPLVVA